MTAREHSTRITKSPGTWLIALSVVLAVITVVVGTVGIGPTEEPNRLAVSLLQGITLVFSTAGSFVLGKDASRQAAEEAIRPHAKSAFRRVRTLYQALGRLRSTTEIETEYLAECEGAGHEDGLIRLDLALASLDKLRLICREQIATADNALDDWRDLAPDEVADIERAARQTERREDPGGPNA
jgi:hypothetical protein